MSEQLPPGTLTLPELLKKRGLHTAVIGKFFHTTEYAEPQLMAFDRIEHYSPPPDWKGPGAMLKFPPVNRAVKDPAPQDRNSREFRLWRKRHSDRYGDSGLAPEEEGDYRISQTAAALLGGFRQEQETVLPLRASVASAHAPHRAEAIPRPV